MSISLDTGPVQVWKLFDVIVDGYGSAIYTAPTRGKALSRAWRCDAFCHLSFRDFLQIARAKVRHDAPPDHYCYVRGTYGVDVKVGDRIRLRNEGPDWNGKECTVLYPEGPTAHVIVLVDGRDDRTSVHPMSIEVLPAPKGE